MRLRQIEPAEIERRLKADRRMRGRVPSLRTVKKYAAEAKRHSFATLSLAAGDDLATVRDALGHSRIAVTADVYAHVIETTRAQAAERLEAFVMGTGS